MTWRIDPGTGLLDGARQLASPNCDARPEGTEISLLVIHGISLPPNQFGGDEIDQFFTNQLNPEAHPYFRDIYQSRVSSHLLIRRDGEVVQYVPFSKRAWHAGESCYQGRSCCNDFSIGVELEGMDHIPFTDPQYASLARLAGEIMDHYSSITAERLTGHSDIAPGRKTDPGPAFDWGRFRRDLGSLST